MPLLLAAATAALLVQPVCSWDRPGVDRYRGAPAAALAHYRDISTEDRAALARRIAAGVPDDEVAIGPRSIEGAYRYESAIGDMHFGANRICRTVTRAKWAASHREPAQVYCVNDECVLIPRVCGNVSRVRRITTTAEGAPPVPVGSRPPVAAAPPPAMQPAPLPAALPSRPDEPPAWIGPGAPLPVMLPPDYPGPGREISPPLPQPVSAVPEPSQWTMFAAGVAVALWRGRRKK